MAIKKIVTIWDDNKILKENINFLQTKTKAVTFPASDFIKNIIQDLIDTYKMINCAGIAANQIGYDKKIFIGLKHDDSEDENDAEDKKNEEKIKFAKTKFYFWIYWKISSTKRI